MLLPSLKRSNNGGMVTINTEQILTFSDTNFETICDVLASTDPDLKLIIDTYKYPPIWKRPASFDTLIHIILEQQVSLASALAALNKLNQRLAIITPETFLALNNEELSGCFFSRQKIIYTQEVAKAILNNTLNFTTLSLMSNDEVRHTLTKIKGIGNWTVDVYLMMVLQRANIFPLGDVALITSIKEIKNVPKNCSRQEIALIALAWQPYQTIAAFILWHSYVCRRKKSSKMNF